MYHATTGHDCFAECFFRTLGKDYFCREPAIEALGKELSSANQSLPSARLLAKVDRRQNFTLLRVEASSNYMVVGKGGRRWPFAISFCREPRRLALGKEFLFF
jgi:hypothetical protein